MSRSSAEVGVVIRGAIVCIAAACAALAAGCGSGGAGTESNNPGGVNVAIRSSASLGSYLVAGDGRTLYYFGLDLPGTGGQPPVSNCTGSCVPLWPIFHVDAPVLASGLSAADFGELVRSDGAKQTTY